VPPCRARNVEQLTALTAKDGPLWQSQSAALESLDVWRRLFAAAGASPAMAAAIAESSNAANTGEGLLWTPVRLVPDKD